MAVVVGHKEHIKEHLVWWQFLKFLGYLLKYVSHNFKHNSRDFGISWNPFVALVWVSTFALVQFYAVLFVMLPSSTNGDASRLSLLLEY